MMTLWILYGTLEVLIKETAPRRRQSPGTRPQRKDPTVDKQILAHYEHQPRAEEEENRPCYFCLEGWVFIGSVDCDGEEYIESIRCRRCDGSGRLKKL